MNTRELILRALEETEYVGDVRSYSGRGMHGRTCLAVACDTSAGQLVAAIISELTYLVEDYCLSPMQGIRDACEALGDVREDSLGRGSIVYWPDIAAPTESEE